MALRFGRRFSIVHVELFFLCPRFLGKVERGHFRLWVTWQHCRGGITPTRAGQRCLGVRHEIDAESGKVELCLPICLSYGRCAHHFTRIIGDE